MTTKRLKITKLPSREELQKCLSKAAIAIPQLLGKLSTTLLANMTHYVECFALFLFSSDELEEDFTNQKRFLFYGYQCAYWSCLFGQRPGVFANMTDKEVEEAKTLSQDRGYLLHAKKSQDLKARKKVADFMCHDTKTADRFYVANPDHTEAEEVRALVSQSLQQGTTGEKDQQQEQEKEDEEEEMEGGGSSSSSTTTTEDENTAHSSSSAEPQPQDEMEGTLN
ncbi:hypothetical protein F2P81_025522 [Scophthalmus maximus]|uniref:Uncharacterized protein n=1 Tax=Scophthalmus maximus TaxID=52904 RepID=A0A6A4RPH5_SCOMX|nr:hypothetical protein F2P81_025548 [Scophthalmus maximus]KAF0022221.1 hypothetical protein F2P81_025522 [Scophthalmus maximus]